MPIAVPSSSSYAVAGQVNLISQPPEQQANYRQMAGEVTQWNPDAPPQMIERWLQNSYRAIIDYRNWYGLMVRGQVNIPDQYSTGTVTLTNGSTSVVGVGTTWTSDMIGRQFRAGYQNPIYTIIDVPDATTLKLELPWGGITSTSSGYMIFLNRVVLGYNIKRVISMLNQRQGYRLFCDFPQQVLDQNDCWRTQTGFTRFLFQCPPSSAGEPVCELYPIPTVLQAMPFIAYIQPPDLSDDNPFTMSFIRTDVIVLGAISDALLFRGRTSKYYDPNTAMMKKKEREVELLKMARVDDSHFLQDLTWDFNQYPMPGGGMDFAQTHDCDY